MDKRYPDYSFSTAESPSRKTLLWRTYFGSLEVRDKVQFVPYKLVPKIKRVDDDVVVELEDDPAPVAAQFTVAVVLVPSAAGGEYVHEMVNELPAAYLVKGEVVVGP